jgi:peptide-methionine (S)-S-oxide reductase
MGQAQSRKERSPAATVLQQQLPSATADKWFAPSRKRPVPPPPPQVIPHVSAKMPSPQRSLIVRRAPAAVVPSVVKLSGTVALGAGCYWGTEKYIKKNFQTRFPGSIQSCNVGFMSPLSCPIIQNPTYEQVGSGATSDYIEVLLVELVEPEIHFEELIRFFFQFHDPTTQNRQGNDVGFHYASWIFCADEAQIAIATRVREQLQTAINLRLVRCYEEKEICTQITTPLTEFTMAPAEHQAYLDKHPNGYCNHRICLKEWIDVLS